MISLNLLVFLHVTYNMYRFYLQKVLKFNDYKNVILIYNYFVIALTNSIKIIIVAHLFKISDKKVNCYSPSLTYLVILQL